MVDHERLAGVLIEFSRHLVGEYEVADILFLLCDRVTEVLPVTGAGVMLADPQGDLRFVAASDEIIRKIESLQIELGEGPCLLAYQTRAGVVITDLAIDDTFPRFGPRAIKQGLLAVHSFPMQVLKRSIGALNLYRRESGAFDKADADAGQILADIATTSILNARTAEESQRLNRQLQYALDSRIVIEQAKGKLSEQWSVDVSEAFTHLRRYARSRGAKLHVVAQQVVSGDLRLEKPGEA